MTDGMSQDISTPVTRVRSVPDLLGIVPHLLGFHPEESLVMIVIAQGRVVLTARTGLADVGPDCHLELMIDRMLLRWPGALLWLVGYCDDERDAWTLLHRAQRHLGDALAGDLVCVCGGRYRVGNRFGPQYPHDPGATTTAAEATLHGLQARHSRADLARGLRTDPGQADLVEGAWMDGFSRFAELPEDQRADELLLTLRRGLAHPDRLDTTDLAWLGILVTDPDARDRAVLSLTNAAADGWVAVWTRVVRASPYGDQVQPLALLALAAWAAGEGALQSVCLEELDALGVRPGLYRLLDDLNAGMVPPSEWPLIRRRLEELLEQ